MHISTLLPLFLTTATASSHKFQPLQPRQAGTAERSYADDDAFQTAMLETHNRYRLEHNVTELVWNETSADFAAEWAERCVFEHSGGPTGENLSAGYANATASVEVWGDERELWDFPSEAPSVFPLPRQRDSSDSESFPDQPEGVDLQNDDGSTFSKETGHFSQLVWRETTSVGCARFECNGETADGDEENAAPGWYVVCEYYPPGNVQGRFDENVLRGDYEGAADGLGSKEKVWWVVGVVGLLAMM